MAGSAVDAIEFHTGIADPVGFAVRMLRKAYRQGARVLVTAQPPTLENLSRQLWLAYSNEFIAHVVVARSKAAQAARTPLWLGASVTAASHEPVVVINLGAAAPADLLRLERLIEVVSVDADDAAAGRQRWRQYAAAGFSVNHTPASDST